MTPREPSTGAHEPGEDPRRRIAELSALYEAARALVGAREQRQVALRTVLSALGALGLRGGALFAADERGRYSLLFAAGLEHVAPGETILVPGPAREWILREGAFPLAGAAAARGLGPLRDRLAGRFDGAVGAAVAGRDGLDALLVFGAPLLGGVVEPHALALLESIAALAAQAFDSGMPRDPGAHPGTDAGRAAGRTLESLRAAHPSLRGLVGDSPALLETCQDLIAVARTRFPVLLAGESGVGKELAARAVHDLSERADGPFEIVDCGSIPRELIESELFGHVRGAFTGAHRDRRGAFALAHRGTLFLDEIGEMPLQLQTRLLRVIQEGRFRRVGDDQPADVDVRLVAATHRDLRVEVEARRFREDLFYRLNVFSVRIAPLRERLEDVVPLLRHFLARQAREVGTREPSIDAAVVEALQRHTWPGNVRELANVAAGLIVRAAGSGRVALADLDQVWRRQHAGTPAPWAGGDGAAGGDLGGWVLDQARAARFNLIEAARRLQQQKRAGRAVALTERSALSYYLTGEILRALAAADGDAERAALALAGDDRLAAHVVKRVLKTRAVLADAAGSPDAARRHFGKLPAGYEGALDRAIAAVGRR